MYIDSHSGWLADWLFSFIVSFSLFINSLWFWFGSNIYNCGLIRLFIYLFTFCTVFVLNRIYLHKNNIKMKYNSYSLSFYSFFSFHWKRSSEIINYTFLFLSLSLFYLVYYDMGRTWSRSLNSSVSR